MAGAFADSQLELQLNGNQDGTDGTARTHDTGARRETDRGRAPADSGRRGIDQRQPSSDTRVSMAPRSIYPTSRRGARSLRQDRRSRRNAGRVQPPPRTDRQAHRMRESWPPRRQSLRKGQLGADAFGPEAANVDSWRSAKPAPPCRLRAPQL